MVNRIKLIWILTFVIGPYIQLTLSRVVKLDKLIAAQVIFRHGNRTPYESYARDPYLNLETFPEGLGALTDIGKKTEFELGRFLRRRYKSLLGNKCSSDKVYVRSTSGSEGRTLISAQYTLAGLLMQCGNESCKGFKENLTVPIHTIPLNEDYFLYPGLTCPTADQQISQYFESDKIKRLLEKYSDLREYLAENSGSPADTISDLYTFGDVLNVENDIGLTLPFWAQQVLKTSNNVLKYFKAVFLKSYTPTTLTKKIQSGFLIKKILNRFSSKTTSRPKSKRVIWLYSAHDSTVASALNALDIFNCKDVQFGASVLFELHRRRCGEYYVQIFYSNSDTECPPPINIPNCGTKCPLHKMYELYEDILPTENETIESLCRL